MNACGLFNHRHPLRLPPPHPADSLFRGVGYPPPTFPFLLHSQLGVMPASRSCDSGQ